jgi:hypothetical protein
MGEFHSQVTVSKGIRHRVVHGRHGRRGRKRKHGRSADDMSVVTIRNYVLGPMIGGELVAKSSNVISPMLGSEWTGGAKEKIETRLRDGGGREKGRVLFAELNCLNSPTAPVAAICFHIERADEVVITSFDCPRTYTDHRRTLFEAMLGVVEAVACENNRGNACHVIVEVKKDQAGWYEQFGFKQTRRHHDAKNRRLLAIQHAPCRKKKAAQQRASR